jgi:acyl-CoA reductase-like NAD-dependent aldehyde dehydrogenase
MTVHEELVKHYSFFPDAMSQSTAAAIKALMRERDEARTEKYEREIELLRKLEALVKERDEALEELEIWQSVFPDVAPRSVIPQTETMLREARNAARDEVEKVVEKKMQEWFPVGSYTAGNLLEAIRALKEKP